MSIEVLLLLCTAVLAVVAVAAALMAVRAVRRLDRTADSSAAATVPEISRDLVRVIQPQLIDETRIAPVVRVVEGRVVAAPTEQQVIATVLGRPAVRLSVYAAGLAHALRPESRDRIQALMRREFRRRRRVRHRMARRAARSVPAQMLHRDETWLGGTQTADRDYPRAAGE